ncbi:UNVERIFIED_CONTAM: AAA domain-containing protein [Acetivibrio alkalicellulosi]
MTEKSKYDLNNSINQKDQIDNKIKYAQKILNIKNINDIKFDVDIMTELNNSNRLLGLSCEDINNDAYEKIMSHIQTNFLKVDQNAENWIREGTIKYLKESDSGVCPYCGQATLNIKELISVYKNYFSDAYTNFSDKTIEKLSENYVKIKQTLKDNQKIRLKEILIDLKAYYEFLPNDEYKTLVGELESNILNMENLISLYDSEVEKLLEIYTNKTETKKIKPYEPLECIKLEIMENTIKKIQDREKEINIIIEKINNYICKIQDGLKDNRMKEDSLELKKNIEKLELIELKDKWSDKCIEYSRLISDLDKLKEKIIKKQDALKNTMDDFLTKYFDKINHYLMIFGSKHFKIEKKISTNGNMPVISLNIKFKGQEVNEKNIKNVLSESDIRALALSIFWGKLTTKDEQVLSNTIIVLDDPITSFDKNRLLLTIDEIFTIHKICRQVIIFSHFENSLFHTSNL